MAMALLPINPQKPFLHLTGTPTLHPSSWIKPKTPRKAHWHRSPVRYCIFAIRVLMFSVAPPVAPSVGEVRFHHGRHVWREASFENRRPDKGRQLSHALSCCVRDQSVGIPQRHLQRIQEQLKVALEDLLGQPLRNNRQQLPNGLLQRVGLVEMPQNGLQKTRDFK